MDEATGFRANEAAILSPSSSPPPTPPSARPGPPCWEKQMKDCGIQIVRFHVPSAWWFGDTTGLARRDFELGAFAWVGQADPGGQTLWACDQIPTPDNNWAGQNDMGWCNEKATHGHQERQQHPDQGRPHCTVQDRPAGIHQGRSRHPAVQPHRNLRLQSQADRFQTSPRRATITTTTSKTGRSPAKTPS